MKPINDAPKTSVPRLNSLRHRLQKNPGDDPDANLDKLMYFLDSPPSGVKNRWVIGAAMCKSWGVTSSGPAVHRLYLGYLAEWRREITLRTTVISDLMTEKLNRGNAQLALLRTNDVLSDPDAPITAVISLARLQLARQKYLDGQLNEVERALAILSRRAIGNMAAQFALSQYKSLIGETLDKLSPFLVSRFTALHHSRNTPANEPAKPDNA